MKTNKKYKNKKKTATKTTPVKNTQSPSVNTETKKPFYRRLSAKQWKWRGRAAILIGILCMMVPLLYNAKSLFTKAYLIRLKNSLYMNEKNVALDRVYFQSSDMIVTIDSSTLDDGFTIDESKMGYLGIAEAIRIKDYDNQSSYVASGSSDYGVVIKNGQVFGLLETENSEMVGGFIIKDSETIPDEYRATPTEELLADIIEADSKKVKYEGDYTTPSGESVSRFHVVVKSGGEWYLYLSNKTHHLVRTVKIDKNNLQITDITPFTEELQYFDSMENYQSFALISAKDFDSIYRQFAFYALTTSGLGVGEAQELTD